MWKLVIIRYHGVTTMEGSEEECRHGLEIATGSSVVLFAFLYNGKPELVETYFGSFDKR
jgi:hypothetical protein